MVPAMVGEALLAGSLQASPAGLPDDLASPLALVVRRDVADDDLGGHPRVLWPSWPWPSTSRWGHSLFTYNSVRLHEGTPGAPGPARPRAPPALGPPTAGRTPRPTKASIETLFGHCGPLSDTAKRMGGFAQPGRRREPQSARLWHRASGVVVGEVESLGGSAGRSGLGLEGVLEEDDHLGRTPRPGRACQSTCGRRGR